MRMTFVGIAQGTSPITLIMQANGLPINVVMQDLTPHLTLNARPDPSPDPHPASSISIAKCWNVRPDPMLVRFSFFSAKLTGATDIFPPRSQRSFSAIGAK